jgi:DNA-binding transcriptional ArsR family regulator
MRSSSDNASSRPTGAARVARKSGLGMGLAHAAQNAGVETVRLPRQAAALLHHPLRLRILSALGEPDSATGVARRMQLPRQTVNYHVRQLARAHLLARAGRRMRRRMVEQCYVATARGYVLSPELLGNLAADPARVQDALSVAYLQGLASRMQSELAEVSDRAARAGKRLATLSISTALRFISPEQRAAFTAALQSAILSVVQQHSAPFTISADPSGAASVNSGESAAAGRPYRLVLGCYPLPPNRSEQSEKSALSEKSGESTKKEKDGAS